MVTRLRSLNLQRDSIVKRYKAKEQLGFEAFQFHGSTNTLCEVITQVGSGYYINWYTNPQPIVPSEWVIYEPGKDLRVCDNKTFLLLYEEVKEDAQV